MEAFSEPYLCRSVRGWSFSEPIAFLHFPQNLSISRGSVELNAEVLAQGLNSLEESVEVLMKGGGSRSRVFDAWNTSKSENFLQKSEEEQFSFKT